MSTKRQRRRKKPQPFINGFALTAPGSYALHVITDDVKYGSVGHSLCKTVAGRPQGWIEPPEAVAEQKLYCSSCMLIYRRMYEDEDPRLQFEDRMVMESILYQFRVDK